jgi:DNA-binding CsgD family transcriptional regulator
VLILTSFDSDRALVDAGLAGASGFILKQIRSSELVDAIRGVADGRRYLDDAEVRLASRRLRESEEGRLDDLTAQERRIFDLIGEGNTNRQIAQEMYLAEKTVKNYVSNLLAKLGMSTADRSRCPRGPPGRASPQRDVASRRAGVRPSGNAPDQAVPGRVVGAHRARAPEFGRPPHHVRQPAGAFRLVRESDAVVADPQRHGVADPFDADLGGGGVGVAHDVRQPLGEWSPPADRR